jgi:hypothetical protein
MSETRTKNWGAKADEKPVLETAGLKRYRAHCPNVPIASSAFGK